MDSKKDFRFISSFILKIIAIVTMTIDHIGLVFYYSLSDITLFEGFTLYNLFRTIGRFAFPIFIFCLIEGLRHTKDIKKYLVRLLVGTGIIYVAMTVLNLTDIYTFTDDGNIFLTLFLCALSYYLFKNKKTFILGFIPLIFSLSCGAVDILTKYEVLYIEKNYLTYSLCGLYPQYPILGCLLFYPAILFHKLYDNKIAKILNNDKETIKEYKLTPSYQSSRNILFILVVILITFILYALTYLPSYSTNLSRYMNMVNQSYMILACIPIFFYNGKKGYKSRLSQYFFYFYYPLHLIIIVAISNII